MDDTSQPPRAGPSRLDQLSADFAALAPRLAEGPQKQAFSLLFGMLQEVWRSHGADREDGRGGPWGDRSGGAGLDDLLRLHERAPPMEGDALSPSPPAEGPAPEFALRDATGQEVTLASYRGRTVVLAFYPLDWSPGCSKQLDLYQSERDEFSRRGVEVIGISVDSLYSHGAWAAARGLTLPLLADFNPKGAVARRYGVWREVDGFSERALFVIDGAGVIRHAHVSPRLQDVPDIYALYAVLDALGHTAPSPE